MGRAEAVGVVLPGAISAPLATALLYGRLHARAAPPALVVRRAIAAGEVLPGALLSRLIDVGAGPILHRSPPPAELGFDAGAPFTGVRHSRALPYEFLFVKGFLQRPRRDEGLRARRPRRSGGGFTLASGWNGGDSLNPIIDGPRGPLDSDTSWRSAVYNGSV